MRSMSDSAVAKRVYRSRLALGAARLKFMVPPKKDHRRVHLEGARGIPICGRRARRRPSLLARSPGEANCRLCAIRASGGDPMALARAARDAALLARRPA